MVELGPAARAAGYRAEHVAEIGSTNAALLARARGGEAGPCWLVADTQSSGRGRNARSWSSPPGNLYASLLLGDPALPAALPQLSFVLSLALRDAVLAAAHLYDSGELRLKWPNDLMAEGLKTAGMLLEGGVTGGTAFVVAGMGVNIVSHPELTNHAATDLTAAGFRLDRDGLFVALGEAVVDRLAQWRRGAGFESIRHDWLRVAHGVGAPLRVNTVTDSFEAIFEGVDAMGRLIAHTPHGPRLVSAADVFVLGVEKEEAR